MDVYPVLVELGDKMGTNIFSTQVLHSNILGRNVTGVFTDGTRLVYRDNECYQLYEKNGFKSYTEREINIIGSIPVVSALKILDGELPDTDIFDGVVGMVNVRNYLVSSLWKQKRSLYTKYPLNEFFGSTIRSCLLEFISKARTVNGVFRFWINFPIHNFYYYPTPTGAILVLHNFHIREYGECNRQKSIWKAIKESVDRVLFGSGKPIEFIVLEGNLKGDIELYSGYGKKLEKLIDTAHLGG